MCNGNGNGQWAKKDIVNRSTGNYSPWSRPEVGQPCLLATHLSNLAHWYLTFYNWHLTFDIWHLTFNIWHLTFNHWTNGAMDQWTRSRSTGSICHPSFPIWQTQTMLEKSIDKTHQFFHSRKVRWLNTSSSKVVCSLFLSVSCLISKSRSLKQPWFSQIIYFRPKHWWVQLMKCPRSPLPGCLYLMKCP